MKLALKFQFAKYKYKVLICQSIAISINLFYTWYTISTMLSYSHLRRLYFIFSDNLHN